jgi:signal transduction histidine kinase/ActR/RegA family two-component response regulator
LISASHREHASWVSFLDRLPAWAGGASIVVGAAALLGWQWNVASLKSVLPGLVAMNPLTAGCFILAGLSLIGLRYRADRATRNTCYGLAALVTMAGVSKLCDLTLDTTWNLDQLFFGSKLGSAEGLPPNRMAPNTALNFSLVGVSLLIVSLRLRGEIRPAQLLVLVPLGFSILAILGYVLNVQELYGLKTYIPMAHNTALTFCLLSSAILFTRPKSGITRVLVADDAGGAMARSLLPLALLTPVLLAVLRIHAERAGLVGGEPGISVMVFVSSVLLTGLIWLNATRLSRADAARKEAVDELKLAHQVLDDRVRERTSELEAANHRLRAEIDERLKAEAALKSSEAQLRQAQKMEAVGRLAGGVAHDFNNLLTAILGYSQLLRCRKGVNETMIEDIAEVEKAADRAASLTRQLLAFSRQQVLQPKVLDLNSVITDMDKMLRRLIGEDIDLLTAPAGDLGRVKADPGQIEQVLMNLVVNARDAIPGAGGKLTIETLNVTMDETATHGREGFASGRYVMLAVSDNGTGMDAETRSRIFEPFFTTKEVGRGTGLGLSTVHGIVKQSGGHIDVYSEPGRGTTFKIYLPRVDAPLDSLAPARTPLEIARGTETILVVEDEELVRRVVTEGLRLNGYTVIEATDRSEALRVCQALLNEERAVPDLMLTDVVMPGMSIAEFLEGIRTIGPEMKIVYMSGYTDRAMSHQGVFEEGVAFLQKPFTIEALMRRVREILDEPLRRAA